MSDNDDEDRDDDVYHGDKPHSTVLTVCRLSRRTRTFVSPNK